MMLHDMLQALNDTGLATAIRENGLLFPWLEVAHVMSISLVLGSIAIVDLRLVGIASTSYPVSRLTRALLPLTWTGFACAVLTGGLLFSSQPLNYFVNIAFRMKMVMLVAAGLNMAVFHLFTQRGGGAWDAEAPTPAAAKAAGILSILIWIMIAAFGRWIGFTLNPF